MDMKLINFRTPANLLKAFDFVCDYKSQTRTQVLIEMMREFVEVHHQPILRQIENLNSLNDDLSKFINSNDSSIYHINQNETETNRDIWEDEEADFIHPFFRG